MKFQAFRNRSLIMGSLLAAQALQSWLKKNSKDSSLSFLGSLIILAVHFEGKEKKSGPSKLAASLGFSRSRVSQEISLLVTKGYARRGIVVESARSISISLTPLGEKKAMELIKLLTKLQNLIDQTVGENEAEKMNNSLIKLTGKIRSLK